MSDCAGDKKELLPILRDILDASGAVAWGVAEAAPVAERDAIAFDRWLAEGHNAAMEYMRNWREIRLDPRLLLDGAASVISFAFAYPASKGIVASYALGDDYHDVLRKMLGEVAENLKTTAGGEYRICIDSAPILERYWAVKCGVGRRVRNGLICLPGYGTRVFLAEIVSTLKPEILNPGFMNAGDGGNPEIDHVIEFPDGESECGGCDLCMGACPAGALQDDGTVDARRCLSYLTIEHRGDWDDEGLKAMSTAAGRNTLFGCDICQRVCRHNTAGNTADKASDSILTALKPRSGMIDITAEKVAGMTQHEFGETFRKSAIKRAKLAGLRRNALNMLRKDSDYDPGAQQ